MPPILIVGGLGQVLPEHIVHHALNGRAEIELPVYQQRFFIRLVCKISHIGKGVISLPYPFLQLNRIASTDILLEKIIQVKLAEIHQILFAGKSIRKFRAVSGAVVYPFRIFVRLYAMI